MTQTLAPPPPRDYALDGSCGTGRYRIRPAYFFGFCVLEELVEYRDGRSVWQKCKWTTGFSLDPFKTGAGR